MGSRGRCVSSQSASVGLTARVSAINMTSLSRRGRDAYVTERGALHDAVGVRANKQSDVHRVGQRYTAELLRDEAVAESPHGHDVHAASPLELDHGVRIGQTVARLVLFRHRADGPAELERHQAVAVPRRGHVHAIRCERGANGPPDFPMLLDPGADEARAGREREIARHPLPNELKIVAVAPHVLAGTADQVLLPGRIVRDGAGAAHVADIAMAVEDAEQALYHEKEDCDHDAILAQRALGGVGALLGTIVGSETKTVSWARVPLRGGRPALGLRISF